MLGGIYHGCRVARDGTERYTTNTHQRHRRRGTAYGRAGSGTATGGPNLRLFPPKKRRAAKLPSRSITPRQTTGYGSLVGTSQMCSQQVTSVKISATTSEQARDARARAWRFVFECYENNKTAGAIRGEGGADLDRRVRTAKGVKPGTS
jgi:hypothetical protein